MRKYTHDLLMSVTLQSHSFSEVIRRLGLRESGGNHSHIARRIKEYNIDTSHFKKATDFLRPGTNKKHYDQILVLRNSRRELASRLRRAMIEAGFDYRCAGCGIEDSYNNSPIVLEVNHKDGNWLDNRRENLEFRCPNCHSQYHGPVAK